MANRTYIEQQKLLDSNLQKWNTFISTLSTIVSQYQTNIDALQKQIKDNQTEISALKSYIDVIKNAVVVDGRLVTDTYITTDTKTIEVQSVSSISGEDSPSVFHVSSNSPTVYMFVSKVISGITINGLAPTSATEPVYSFAGSTFGDAIEINAVEVRKTDNMTISFNMTGNATDPMDATVDVNILYNQVSFIATDNKPVNSITDLANKFKSAANSLNGLTVTNDVINRLEAISNSNTSSNMSIDGLNNINDLTTLLLGGATSVGVVVKKTNQLS